MKGIALLNFISVKVSKHTGSSAISCCSWYISSTSRICSDRLIEVAVAARSLHGTTNAEEELFPKKEAMQANSKELIFMFLGPGLDSVFCDLWELLQDEF
jgi:hypothetical protein